MFAACLYAGNLRSFFFFNQGKKIALLLSSFRRYFTTCTGTGKVIQIERQQRGHVVLQLSLWAVPWWLSASFPGPEGQVLEDTPKALLWSLQMGRA